ncbi:GNAT family N-acetyltransferase [Liquorilactobacillus nagelii]|uniref:GNAT family N-acetyltransferase n=1 Tax=Liquorilactobacillus nagelii TaxID=82688 RepID=UPI0039E94079
MKILLDSVNEWNLKTVMEIERSSFSLSEAASISAMKQRQHQIPETFLGAFVNFKLVGFIVGPAISRRYLTDDLFSSVTKNFSANQAPYQAVLSLAVAPAYRKKGIASQLLQAIIAQAQDAGRQGVTLTCLPTLITFYQKNGFQDEGIAESKHADETWHNLFLQL